MRKDQESVVVSGTGEFMATIYNDKVLEYKNNLELIETSNRFLGNSTGNLNQELCQYIYNQQHVKKVSLHQKGKYFKKWSQLSNEEKLDRYYCYVEYFINKYLVEPGLLAEIDAETTINNVKNLITENVNRIKFKDIKWTVKSGIIEHINPLKYKEEDKTFFLTDEKEKVKDVKQKIKKSSSVRTLFNKESEKVINEDLVVFIIQSKKNKKLTVDNIKNLKEEFIEKLKIRLLVKRVTVNDKNEVFKKFDDIYNVIINNDSSSCG
jgi:hypothetical protein